MSVHRSHIDTAVECCHCVLGGETQQGALSGSYQLCVFPLLYQKKLERSMVSALVSSLHLSASHPSAPSFRSFFTICILSFLDFHLHSCHLIFVPSLISLCRSLSLSFRLGMYDSPCITIVEGKKGTFRSPLLPFPKIPEGH